MGERASLEIVPHGSERYRQTVDLRLRILRAPLGLSFTPEEIAGEADSIHLAAILDGEVAACMVLVPKPDGEMKMRQVAVSQERQSMGLGSWLVRESEQICRERKATRITLHARESAVQFYERLDYQVEGDPFVEVGVPHRFMSKDLTVAG